MYNDIQIGPPHAAKCKNTIIPVISGSHTNS